MNSEEANLSIKVVVRRVRTGARPYGWEIQGEDGVEPIYVSPDSFPAMEAAYRAGQARLAEFIPKRSMPPAVTEYRPGRSRIYRY
jgi:hypothetical protein